MRLVTWNVRHGRPHHGFASNRRLARAVAGLGADVLGVQEVERRVIRSWFADQPKLVARAAVADMYAYAPARNLAIIGSDGVAICVRGRIVRREVLKLEGEGLHQDRVALFVEADVEAGGRVSIACTHLQNIVDEARVQLAMVLDAFTSWPGPRVVLGDLNLATSDVIGPLESAGFTVAGGGFTSPAWEPYQRIDHVAVNGLTLSDDVDTPAVPVSDHRPVIADAW